MSKDTQPSLADQLRGQLDPQLFAALARSVESQRKRDVDEGYARAMREHASYFNAMDTARGLAKSWTAWAGAALLALPEVLPAIQADLPKLLGPNAAEIVMRFCGVLMILLRFRTKSSLADKGGA